MRRLVIGAVIVAMVGGSVAPAAAQGRRWHGELPPVPGLAVTESTRTFDATLASLTAAIAASPAGIVDIVDHAAAAEAAGRDLSPATVVCFGNPRLGTPLMQADQVAGIDLPQKILVWQEHRLIGERQTLGAIATALRTLGHHRRRGLTDTRPVAGHPHVGDQPGPTNMVVGV